jgi:glycosyltransferase involved in cell wall biosynthesis
MRVLLLVQKEQRVILDAFYDSIARHAGDCDVMRLDSQQQSNLKQTFKYIDTDQYDRIVFFLRFKKEIKQRRFIRTVPNLVILEHDAYQNYIADKYQGRFSEHYRALPWARILVSGYSLADRLRGEGFDAVFVPKGYDQTQLSNRRLARDIELGFLGSTDSQTYDGRRALLEKLGDAEKMLIQRTASGEEYVATLNRIRFFVSADVGLGEYMIKNFEAMACGCVLLAWDQGAPDNTALGFNDMENIVLYRNLEELRAKLHTLRSEAGLAERIAAAGQSLAEERYTWERLGAEVATAVQRPLRRKRSRSLVGVTRYFWEDSLG